MMNAVVKITLTGVVGFSAFSILSSFTIDNTVTFLTSNNIAISQVPTLEMWSGRFLVLGVGSMIGLLTIMAPIPRDVKALALFSEFIGGAIAWLLV